MKGVLLLLLIFGNLGVTFSVEPTTTSHIGTTSGSPPTFKTITISTSRQRCQSRIGVPRDDWHLTYSIMFAARNDKYAGDAPERLYTSLYALYHYLAKVPTLSKEVEVIVADWGSDQPLWQNEHAKRLEPFQLLQHKSRLRYLVVPLNLAKQFSKHVLSEVHAYNLAARVACGRYLLRLDQDTMVGPEFVSFMHNAAFHETSALDKVWWCGRRETPEADYAKIVVDPTAVIDQQGKSYPLWHDKQYMDLDGAVGVLGMPRSYWHSITGYNENMTLWGHMENELFARMQRNAETTKNPLAIINLHQTVDNGFYHIWHKIIGQNERGQNERTLAGPQPDWGLRQHLAQVAEVVIR